MDILIVGCVFVAGCVFTHIVSKPGNTNVESEQAPTLPLTDEERLQALTPDKYMSKIIEIGEHKRYCIYNNKVVFVYDDLQQIRAAFAAELGLN